MKFLCLGECGRSVHSIGLLMVCAHCGGTLKRVESDPTDAPSALALVNESAINRDVKRGLSQIENYLKGW